MSEYVSLVEDEKARFCLHVNPPQDAEAMRSALRELVIHLEKCLASGIVWFERDRTDLPPVRLELSLAANGDLDREEFEISASPDTVTLCASTVDGLEHAVHYFLEQAFGIRWLWPGENGTVIPQATSVRWPCGCSRHKPDWSWRRLWLGGAFWKEDDPFLAEVKYGGVKLATLDKLSQWQKRNRLGGLKIADGHRWAQICSPLEYGETRPEYFALVKGQRDTVYQDGKHSNQPCTSNPEVIKLTAEYVKAQFRNRSDLDGFSIALNDGHGFCECDDCLKIDSWAGLQARDDGDFDATVAEGGDTELDRHNKKQPVITDRIFLFVNQVAELVAEEFPDKLLLTLVYGPYRTSPKRVKLHPNVIAQFCSMSWTHTVESVYKKEMSTFKSLQQFSEKLGIYDYFINGRNGTFPRGFAKTFHRSLKTYYDLGGRFFATQAGLDFATNGFAYYLAARCLWDGNQTFESVLEDFCRAGFGPAQDCVKNYILAFVDRWEATEAGTSLGQDKVEFLAIGLYPNQWRAKRREDLRDAAGLAGENQEIGKRIKFLEEGLDFLDLFCNAAIAVRDLVSDGTKNAVERRNALLDWVDAHRNGFWISGTWFDYQRLCRRGLFGSRSDNWEG